MSGHNHTAFVAGCFRCDLSRVELRIPPHECNGDYRGPIACPEPCGQHHRYCLVCDKAADGCILDGDGVA